MGDEIHSIRAYSARQADRGTFAKTSSSSVAHVVWLPTAEPEVLPGLISATMVRGDVLDRMSLF